MNHGSLFSGIGGFDLAAEWMGWENVFHCEWNLFGQKVLKHYWPKAISYEDITKTDFTKHKGTIDIISGGFPCQPYSMAGKRKGKEDKRHLWPEMLRTIREVQPRWVVGENVFGIINWSGGLVFHEVQADLEAEGYEVWPYVLAAAGVGASHKRDRVWFVAYNNKISRCNMGFSRIQNKKQRKTQERSSCWFEFQLENCRNAPVKWRSKKWKIDNEPALINDSHGLSTKLDGITFYKWANESNGAAGNAIVPQVAFQIFKSIEQYEKSIY